MVADALIYHPTVSHYIKYVATTVGRDKALRLIQYFARFYAWYLYRMNTAQSSIAPWEAIKKQFGLTRKLMRVGKFVEHFRLAAQASDSKSMDPVLRYCAIGRQLGYAGYLTLDALTVPDSLGIRKSDKAKQLSREASRMWMVGLLFNVVAGTYTLWRLQQRSEANEKKQDGEGVVEGKKLQREFVATQIQLVSDVCDLTIPTSALGYLDLDDGIVGLAGTISSSIGCWGMWKKTA